MSHPPPLKMRNQSLQGRKRSKASTWEPCQEGSPISSQNEEIQGKNQVVPAPKMWAWAFQGAQVCLKNLRNYSGIPNILVPPFWFSTIFHACHMQGQAHLPTHMCAHTHAHTHTHTDTHWVSLPNLPDHPPYPPQSLPTFLLLITEPFYLFNCSLRFIKLLPCCAMLSHFSHVRLFTTL